jgi:hypothetical protein
LSVELATADNVPTISKRFNMSQQPSSIPSHLLVEAIARAMLSSVMDQRGNRN